MRLDLSRQRFWYPCDCVRIRSRRQRSPQVVPLRAPHKSVFGLKSVSNEPINRPPAHRPACGHDQRPPSVAGQDGIARIVSQPRTRRQADYSRLMARKLKSEAAAKLFLAIGIAGILVGISSVVLIVLAPSMPAPYITTVAGGCLILAGFLGWRALRKVSSSK